MDRPTDKYDPLDLAFKKILRVIRQHIPYVNSNAYLMQCRLWLEKLSYSNANKKLRNIYLAELCQQIQANKLLPPFNEAPPRGELKAFSKIYVQADIPKPDEGSSQEHLMLSEEVETNPLSLNNTEPLQSGERLFGKLKNKPRKSAQNLGIRKQSDTEGDNTMSCGEPINQSKKEVPLPIAKSKEIISDDSWSDLTEASSDAEVTEHIQNKNSISNNTYKPAKKLNKHIQWQSKDLLISPNIASMKFLSDTNYLSQDGKKTIEALQLRLSEMIQQNNKLNTIVQKLKVQLEHNRTNNQAQNLHNQEVAQLKEIHAQHLLQLEESHKANITGLSNNYEEKIRTISSSYEQQISDIKKQNEDEINKKDSEVSRLSEIIQDQCLRILNDISALKNQVANCTCEKKVHILKKCVSKMDKLFQRSEKEYVRQIEHLKQELEVKESALQVKLQMQKAELIAQTRTGQKEEFEEILNSLEVKYIKMLEGHEHQIMKIKKQDDDKIQYLSELLEKNGIPYNDSFEYTDQQ